MGIKERRANFTDKKSLATKPNFKKTQGKGGKKPFRPRNADGKKVPYKPKKPDGNRPVKQNEDEGPSKRAFPSKTDENVKKGSSQTKGRKFSEPKQNKSEGEAEVKKEVKTEVGAEEGADDKPRATLLFKVNVAGLTDPTFGKLRALTQENKIPTEEFEIKDGTVTIIYKAKKHALRACNVLCGLDFNGDSIHASLKGDNDEKKARRTRLIIRNLPWSATEESLKEVFHKYGAVTEVKIPTKPDGKMRGFGFVQFTHGHESAKAVKGVKQIDNRRVAVDWCLPREDYQAEKKSEAPPPKEEEEEEDENSDAESDDEDASVAVADETNQPIGTMSSSEDETEDEDDCNSDSHHQGTEDKTTKTKEPVKPKLKTGEAEDVKEGRSVFLRNLPFDATEDDLADLGAAYGEVIKVSIVKNDVGVPKGVAFLEFTTKAEADDCILNTKDLSLNGRAVFARAALSQNDLISMKKNQDDLKALRNDKRNLGLAREGEVREGSKAFNEMSELDRSRREKFGELKFQKLKNVENFVDPTKIVIHNIPKSKSEADICLLARKAANGDIRTEVGKRKCKVSVCHLMMNTDPEEENSSRGFAFVKFEKEAEALRALRILNNHPTAFFDDKRPIVEFAVENAKALKILEDRSERNKKKIELRKQVNEVNGPVPGQVPKRKRPWQLAKEERKKKRRAERNMDKTSEVTEENTTISIDSVPSKPKTPKTPKVTEETAKPEYSGMTIERGPVGQLKRPKHTGAKIRARDRGKITVQRQQERKVKRKENIKKLSVNVKKEKGQKPKEKSEDPSFDQMVSSFKSKISAGLKLL